MLEQGTTVKKVMDVGGVTLDVLESNPPKLKIHADGKVPTGGWGKGHLIPYVYVQPPPDGIYDYDFVGEAPPDGTIVTTVVSPISAERLEDPMPEGLKGVRVHACNNSVTEMLP